MNKLILLIIFLVLLGYFVFSFIRGRLILPGYTVYTRHPNAISGCFDTCLGIGSKLGCIGGSTGSSSALAVCTYSCTGILKNSCDK